MPKITPECKKKQLVCGAFIVEAVVFSEKNKKMALRGTPIRVYQKREIGGIVATFEKTSSAT